MSCLKQTLTPTLAPVTPTRTKSPEEVDRAKEAPTSGVGDCRNNLIAKYSFEGKMKDGCISKLTITKTGHQATQYKKIIETLPVLCIDKNFRYINDVLCTWTDLEEVTFLPVYPNSDQC